MERKEERREEEGRRHHHLHHDVRFLALILRSHSFVDSGSRICGCRILSYTPTVFGWEILYHYRGLLTIVKSAVHLVYNNSMYNSYVLSLMDGNGHTHVAWIKQWNILWFRWPPLFCLDVQKNNTRYRNINIDISPTHTHMMYTIARKKPNTNKWQWYYIILIMIIRGVKKLGITLFNNIANNWHICFWVGVYQWWLH